MNKENILLLAHFIQEHPELPFNMGSTSPASCRTPGCIAGFACTLWPELLRTERTHLGQSYVSWNLSLLEEKLGIASLSHLIYPGDNDRYFEGEADDPDYRAIDYDELTRSGAISTLLRLAETGEVIWKREEQI